MAKEGYHVIYAINLECAEFNECGDGVFAAENGVLFRIG